ncbi:hypothetical protein QR680_000291 [Steinernema hermaphroditum]|uniref:C-type lectin domain-containing protein n=1 Tax=Steinernema hermaphroditum TaxID=289476 RepID=A0AA39LDD1_9BILA|nr:hypothetical protein QR680_000291 [Steinernema hermaphroditum]
MKLFLLVAAGVAAALAAADSKECPDGWSVNSGFCYKMHQGYEIRKNFADAEAHCVSQGGHLASIHSEAEDKFVTSLFDLNTPDMNFFFWIGAHANVLPNYGWTDGSPFDYTNWMDTAFFPLDEPCGIFFTGADNKWTVVKCSIKQNYLCKRSVGK